MTDEKIIGDNTKRYCPFCGDELEEHAKFCASCGESLPEEATNPGNPEEGNGIYKKPEGYDKKSRIPPNPPNPPNPKHNNDDYDEEEDDKTINLKITPERIKFKQSSDNDDSTVRLNISVPDSKRKEWKTLAATLGESVSGLVRTAMKGLQEGLKDFDSFEDFEKKMEKFGRDMDKMGREVDKKGSQLEKAIRKGKIGDIEEEIEKNVRESLEKGLYKYSVEDKDRIKKRIKGLIKLQGVIPIDKLSQALEISEEDAENMIYELAAEGIEGKLEEGVFKYTSNEDEVIEKFFKLIDKL